MIQSGMSMFILETEPAGYVLSSKWSWKGI